MTIPGIADRRDPAGRFNPGVSGNLAGRIPRPGQLPTLTLPVRERIMAGASRQIPAIGEDGEGKTVSLFEGCVEVLGSARKGNRKSAAEYVRMVQLAAVSVPPLEPFPEPWPRETIDAVITQGSEEEFEALLASQQAFFRLLVTEYSDRELATTFARVAPRKSAGGE